MAVGECTEELHGVCVRLDLRKQAVVEAMRFDAIKKSSATLLSFEAECNATQDPHLNKMRALERSVRFLESGVKIDMSYLRQELKECNSMLARTQVAVLARCAAVCLLTGLHRSTCARSPSPQGEFSTIREK